MRTTLFLLLTAPVVAADPKPGDVGTAEYKKAAGLVHQLGHRQYAVREAAAKQLIVLADSSKFERAGRIRIAPIEQASTVITDRAAPSHHVTNLRDRGIEVILV